MSGYDMERVEHAIAEEEKVLAERQPRSLDFVKRASQSLAGGVACSWHAANPHTMYGATGSGSHLVDLDGNDLVDLHCGYGVMVVGHAHPKVVEAVRRRVAQGTHFALPVEDTVVVAEHLAERFDLPLWRFTNSGTEATMDAVRIARAATGRDLIVKVEGCYHGSPDGLDFSTWPDLGEAEGGGPPPAGTVDAPIPTPATVGIPEVFGQPLRLVSMNDLPGLERIFADEGDRIAGMILEPIPMNMGIVPPDEGYLAAVRELTRRHGAMLVFDEVKTGATIAWGGAIAWSGVVPDLICLAKAIGGGLPIGAVGGSEEAMRVVVDGTMEQEGTFNGNPLSMAAARATLTEVLIPDVYPRFEELGRLIVAGVEVARDRVGIPATIQTFGARGGIQFADPAPRNFRERAEISDRVVYLEHLVQLNGGVYEPNGDPWTISVAHTEADVGRYVENFERFAELVAG
jgi:glutamate-1-semialdehyde 2,1-aminomutase